MDIQKKTAVVKQIKFNLTLDACNLFEAVSL